MGRSCRLDSGSYTIYSLSKRSSLYAGYSAGKNTGASNQTSLYYGGAAVAGKAVNPTGWIAGMRHQF